MGSGLDAAKGIWVSQSPNRQGFFKISQRGGRRKKAKKRKKRNERGGTGLSALEASASATSAVSSARPPWAQNPKFALCLGQHGVPMDPVGMALHSISSPASCAPELAAQMWPDSTAGAKPGVQQLGHICPGAGTGGGQPCLGGLPCTPFPSPVLVSGQGHKGCVPREGLCVPRLRAPNPIPQAVERHLPVILVTEIPWDLICTLPSIPSAVGAGIWCAREQRAGGTFPTLA